MYTNTSLYTTHFCYMWLKLTYSIICREIVHQENMNVHKIYHTPSFAEVIISHIITFMYYVSHWPWCTLSVLHHCHICCSDYFRGWLSLQWRHDEREGVSDHQSCDCLLNRLFKHTSKKTSKPCVTGLCVGNSPVTGEFPAQRASNVENVSIWWCHHVKTPLDFVSLTTYQSIIYVEIWMPFQKPAHRDPCWFRTLVVRDFSLFDPWHFDYLGSIKICLHWISFLDTRLQQVIADKDQFILRSQ